jgi:hypothetical protein
MSNNDVYESTIGKVGIDHKGVPVTVLKLDAWKAYTGVPSLLQKYINETDENSWNTIKDKIDYIYSHLDVALDTLDKIEHFTNEITSQVKSGKKLLFKPNIVNPMNIDAITHGETTSSNTSTEWPLIAALMRWFHDKRSISYHQMALGEAGSAMSMTAGIYSLYHNGGKPFPTEAVLEGKAGNFYGGWGFYFVRKYLVEADASQHKDNPMNGYEESLAGKFIPPGQAQNKLMIYDLNRLYDDPSKGREIPVPDGANFKEITLHKVIIGGDPSDTSDRLLYPGCVLVNVPRLKIHLIDLLTNAIKNLGIGLYPQEAPRNSIKGSTEWKYAYPFMHYPGMKTEIPHSIWVPEQDKDSGYPKRDASGKYIVRKTDGIAGTQTDIIRAVQAQNVYMLHIVDGIEFTNISHQGGGTSIPEGFIFASKDPVALDSLCARYCCKTVPVKQARELQKKYQFPDDFFREVPEVEVEGKNLISKIGYDSPLWRYGLYKYAENRGVGKRQYYVKGKDVTTGREIASVDGHLGTINGAKFDELITGTLYYATACFLWDMGKTTLSYAKANDALTGSNYYQLLLDEFDENNDGVISYEETGKKGFYHATLRNGSFTMMQAASILYGGTHGDFIARSTMLKCSNKSWNTEGHDFSREHTIGHASGLAFTLSRLDTERDDPFYPGLKFGKGKWPTIQMALYLHIAFSIFGISYPEKIEIASLYGWVFQHADRTLNGAAYVGSGSLGSAERYVQDVIGGKKPLNFELYIPQGFSRMSSRIIPNIRETTDPEKIFSVSFNSGQEIWKS